MFERGQTYSRQDIHDSLGGDQQSYLPHRDGRVLYGAFRVDTNPGAPFVVLAGTGSGIERAARMLSREHAIPVFIKQAVNEWVYRGRFKLRERNDDASVVAAFAADADRTGDVSMVLFFEPVGPGSRD